MNELYHLTTPAEWAARSPSGYRHASLDDEGFIHCSTLRQLARSADRFFSSTSDLMVLRIDPSRLTSPVVWEDTEGHGDLFPHVRGPIDLAAVVDTHPWPPGDAGTELPEALGGAERLSRRSGVRWGLAGGVALRSITEVRELASWADQAGFDSFWVSQSTAVDPVVALAAVADAAPGLSEVGTSVVPLYGRHPLGLAQMVRTAQTAWRGRFTLGVGPSHRDPVEGALGLSWDRPFAYTCEFLDGLLPLLAGEAADAAGDQVTTRAALDIDAQPTPVLLAALGPRMLELAGRRAAGTTVGQCGPNTIARYIAPTITTAASDAGRPQPRIMALVRVCVTDGSTAQHDASYALANDVAAFYEALPSYAAVIAREGVERAADLFLIGSAAEVTDGLAAYAAAGATDLRIEVVAPEDSMVAATRDALADHLS